LKTSIVFGGHSPIGVAISRELSQESRVLHISRKTDLTLQAKVSDCPNISLISWGSYSHLLNQDKTDLLSAQNCTNLIFAYKYSSESPNDLEQFEVEVLFPMKIIQFMASAHLLTRDSNIIFLTSPAADFVVADQSLNYHISKAAINQMTRFYGTRLAPSTKVNAIAPGSFVLKDRNKNYYKTNPVLKKTIEDFVPLGKISTVSDIARVVAFLVSRENTIINGQILDLSGGYLNYEPSHVFLNLDQ